MYDICIIPYVLATLFVKYVLWPIEHLCNMWTLNRVMCPLIGHLCFVACETLMRYVDIKQGYVSFNRTSMFYGL